MAITYSFVDNEIYGTDDINDITKCLTGAGVAPFISKDSYSTSDLNVMTSALVEAGASLDGCKCSVKNAGTAEMSVTVAQGIVFFESGVRLTVDADGYELPVTPNTAGFVYAYFSPSLQKADIVFNTELPTDGEYVLLAELSLDGILSDSRVFARSRVASFGSNAAYSIPEDKITLYTADDAPSYGDGWNILAEIDLSDIDITKFNYLLYKYKGWSTYDRITEPFERYFDFKNNSKIDFYISGTAYETYPYFFIAAEADKFIFIGSTGSSHSISDLKSAIPYFKLV